VRQANALFARGAQKLILACTEVPVALAAVKAPFNDLTFDPAQALAERCSQLWQAR
jgi:aspartate racemase